VNLNKEKANREEIHSYNFKSSSHSLKSNKNKLIFYLFAFYAFFILVFGLWPFNFFSTNNVAWLKSANGLNIKRHGIMYASTESKFQKPIPFYGEDGDISIELWLKPESNALNNPASILYLFDDLQSEIFSLSQVNSLLKISLPDSMNSAPNWRWLENTFFVGQQVWLAITSNKNKTIVYLNGKAAREYRNYSLATGNRTVSEWHLVIGNNPFGQKPWIGEVYGLAIYNQSLTPEKVYDHYQKWQSNEILSFAKEIGTVALYPMDEQTGDVIHNIAYDRYHLVIPKQFKGLKKNFLKLSRNSLNLSLKSFQDMSINIIGFIPFGYLFFRYIGSLRYRKIPMWQLVIMTISAGVCLSLIVEMSQTFLPTRYSSITDFIFNTLGAAIGAYIAAASHIKAERISSANSNNT
jgi:glycopeptide antibiotics resistance protein